MEQDGGWGWVVVASSFVNHFLLEGLVRSFGLVYIAIIERFGTSASATTWLHAVFNSLQQLGVGPFLGVLIERFTCRKLVIVGGCMLCMSYVTSAYAPHAAFLYFSYSLLGGVGSGLIYSPIVIIVNDYFVKRRGKAMGLAALGAAIGTFAMPPLIIYLFHHYGFTGCLMLLGAISLNHCVVAGFYRPKLRNKELNEININIKDSMTSHDVSDSKVRIDSFTADGSRLLLGHSQRKCHGAGYLLSDKLRTQSLILHDAKHDTLEPPERSASDYNVSYIDKQLTYCGIPPSYSDKNGFVFNESSQTPLQNVNTMGRNENAGSSSPRKASWTTRFSVFKSVPFLLYCFLLYTIPAANTATFVFLPGLAQERGVSSTWSALLISIIGASNIAGSVALGFVFDIPFVTRHRRLFHSILGLLLGASLLVITAIRVYVAMAMVASIYGFLLAGVMGQRATSLSHCVPSEQVHHAFGFMMIFQGLGNLTGPTIQGYLMDHFDSFTVCFLYGGCLVSLSSILLIIEYFACHVFKKRHGGVSSPESTSIASLPRTILSLNANDF